MGILLEETLSQRCCWRFENCCYQKHFPEALEAWWRRRYV